MSNQPPAGPPEGWEPRPQGEGWQGPPQPPEGQGWGQPPQGAGGQQPGWGQPPPPREPKPKPPIYRRPWFIIVGIVAIAWGFKTYYGTVKGKYVVDGVTLKLPVLGLIMRKIGNDQP